MTTATHTPGPWVVSSSFLVCNEEARIIANCTPFREIETISVPVEQAGNNARRIVACVNACEGLPDGWLANSVEERLSAGRDLEVERDRLRSEREELIAMLAKAQELRPRLLRLWQTVPECVLEFCNEARALLGRLK